MEAVAGHFGGYDQPPPTWPTPGAGCAAARAGGLDPVRALVARSRTCAAPVGRSNLAHMDTTAPLRVIVAKPGLDGHDRGAKVVARALRDAGMEVIYTGLHQTPEHIVEAAIQEDADGIGLSVLSGAHMVLFERVVQLLREQDAGDVVVFGGGIIPEEDLPELERMGVARIFTPGATTTEIADWVRTNVGAGRAAS